MRTRSIATVAALLTAASVPLAGSAGGAERRLPSIGGYTAYVSATPVSIRLYEPVVPIPVEPQGELDLAFTQAMTTTGPDQRATASTVWPGAALGDGFGTITATLGLGEHAYPVVANATYPTGERSARLSVGAGDMTASADGRTATAAATSGPTSAGPIAARDAASASTVTLDRDRVAVAAATSASDVDVASGLVRVRHVSATADAASTAAGATASGRSVVTGVSVLGVDVVVDEDGVHVAGEDHPAPGLPADPNDVLRRLGVTVSGGRETSEVNGASARYAAYAFEVTLDTKVFKAAAESTGYREYYDDVIAALPKEIRDYVTDPRMPRAIDFQPRIVVTVGLVTATTSATPEWSVDLPGMEVPVPPVQGGSPAAPGAAPPAREPRGPVPTSGAVPPVSSDAPQPEPVAFTAPLPELFGGLPPALVAALLLGALVAGAGLRRLAAFAGLLAVPGNGCALGAAPGVPDLRKESS